MDELIPERAESYALIPVKSTIGRSLQAHDRLPRGVGLSGSDWEVFEIIGSDCGCLPCGITLVGGTLQTVLHCRTGRVRPVPAESSADG